MKSTRHQQLEILFITRPTSAFILKPEIKPKSTAPEHVPINADEIKK